MVSDDPQARFYALAAGEARRRIPQAIGELTDHATEADCGEHELEYFDLVEALGRQYASAAQANGGILPDWPVRLGQLLVAPADAGDRAHDVLCVFDHDTDEPGAVYALILNRPTDTPAQRLSFIPFDMGDSTAWWGGPTNDVFVLSQLGTAPAAAEQLKPDGKPRPFITPTVGVWLPGADHPPAEPPIRSRLYHGSVWLSAEEATMYVKLGVVLTATNDELFDDEPDTLAERLRNRNI